MFIPVDGMKVPSLFSAFMIAISYRLSLINVGTAVTCQRDGVQRIIALTGLRRTGDVRCYFSCSLDGSAQLPASGGEGLLVPYHRNSNTHSRMNGTRKTAPASITWR